MPQIIIKSENLRLGYEKDDIVINSATFSINSNDFVFITGASGSGKSTILKSFYGEIPIKSGHLSVCMNSLNKISNKNLKLLRRKIGIIFQDYRLINEWSVEKNVMLPLLIKGFTKTTCKKQSLKLLNHVNMLHKADKFPYELSGGEQQRVAMARALAHNPILILCDEPTGNLDDYSSDIVWNLLRLARESLGATVVVVTHRIPTLLRMNYRHFSIDKGSVNEVF